MTFRDYSCQALCWLDMETTGSDAVEDSILEVALRLTGPDLEEITPPGLETSAALSVLLHPQQGWRERMQKTEGVTEMHHTSGLLSAMEHGGRLWSPHELDRAICALFTAYQLEQGHVWLAGSGVAHFDRRFIKEQLPLTETWFPYFSFDTGPLRRATSLWNPDLTLAGHGMADKPHRALGDVELHIEEARHFRRIFQEARHPGES